MSFRFSHSQTVRMPSKYPEFLPKVPVTSTRINAIMTARLHHYIPRFFLEGFVNPEGFVHVFDLATGRQWKAKPDQIARERDFYRIDNPNLPPNTVEEALSQLEHELAPAVVRLRDSRILPGQEEEDFARLANLIAMLGARVPGAINAFADPVAKIGESIVRMMLQTPERYEAFLAERQSKGEDTSAEPTWAQMKEAFESGAIKVTTSQDYRVAIMLQSMDIILPCLSGRSWGLISVSDTEESGPLVCSDRPVSLTWTEKMPAFYSPGWGTTSTELLLPVSGTLGILSAFEPVPTLVDGNAVQVAAANTHALRHSERFLFSPEPRFSVIGAEGQLVGSEKVLEGRRAAIKTDGMGKTHADDH
jgi:hypothetical protein